MGDGMSVGVIYRPAIQAQVAPIPCAGRGKALRGHFDWLQKWVKNTSATSPDPEIIARPA